ncbi:hypothetical protein Q4I28_007150 [Leishmania naiffi]|uniref:Uncharacterized protein n=1 Tax=Leishmania naiffi TaxID=5678 RepID=A0AAW3BC17_9TRYP
MTSLDTAVSDAGPLVERAVRAEATPWSTETFLDFTSFRDACRAWHESEDFFNWLQSSNYAVALLAASNLRPLHFAARERGTTPTASSSHAVEASTVHLVLRAPCCDTTVVLSEEERVTLAKVGRLFPFHVGSKGVATQSKNSTVIPVQSTQLERQHQITAGLLARAHRDGCTWRDRHALGERGGETDETTVSCARQLLLGSPSLCITESVTVRAFCAAVTLRSLGSEVATNAPARVRCLLPRGSPPSVVRQRMAETMAVLDPAFSAVHCEASTAVPRMRYTGSNVNDRILQLFFASKKRLRPEASTEAAYADTDVGGKEVLRYMALLMSLYGYTVVPADGVHSTDAENAGGSEADFRDEETTVGAGSHQPSPQETSQWRSPSTIQSSVDDAEVGHHVHTETATQSELISVEDAAKLLGWHVRCQFCAHGPAIVAVRERVTRTTTTTITTASTLEVSHIASCAASFSTAEAPRQELQCVVDEKGDALQSHGVVGTSVESGSGDCGDGGSKGVLGVVAEVEAPPLSVNCSQQYGKMKDEAFVAAAAATTELENTSDDQSNIARNCGSRLEEGVSSQEYEEGDCAVSATLSSSVDRGSNGGVEDDNVCVSNEVGSSISGNEETAGEENLEAASCSDVEALGEQSTQMCSGVARVQAEATARVVAAAAAVPAAAASDFSRTTAATTTTNVATRATHSVTTITITFSRRPALQRDSQQQLQHQLSSTSSKGHHDSCPWYRLFLTDVIDATALAAPERFMDFTWVTGEDGDTVPDERTADLPNSTTTSMTTSGDQTKCNAHKSAGGASVDGEARLLPPQGPSPSKREGQTCKDSEGHSSRVRLVLRFLLPEVERLITTWRLSEEWERVRPGEYLRHPLWRTWLTSETLHPVHTESADGIMEQYLRTLERQLMPSQITEEGTGEGSRSSAAASDGKCSDGSVINKAATSVIGKTKWDALGTLEELGVTIGAPLCNANTTLLSRTVESALHLANRSLHRYYANDQVAAKAGSAARSGDARTLLREGLQSLLQFSGISASQSVVASSGAGLKSTLSAPDSEDARGKEDSAAVRAFLKTMEERCSDDIVRESRSSASRLRRALQREAIPHALHEFTTTVYPTLRSRAADCTTTTDDLAFLVNTASLSTNADSCRTLCDLDRSRVAQYLQGMRNAAQEEQLQLQREREKAAEAQRLAEAKAAAVSATAAATTTTTTSSAPVARAPATRASASKGPARQKQQQQSQGGRGPHSSPHPSTLPSQMQGLPMHQAPAPSHSNPMALAPHSTRTSSGLAVLQSDVRPTVGPPTQPLGYNNPHWGFPQHSLHGNTGASSPPQPSLMHLQTPDVVGNKALPPTRTPFEGQGGGSEPCNPSAGSGFFLASNVVPGGGQGPIFLRNDRSGVGLDGSAFADDGGPLFSSTHPFGWLPFPSRPSGGDDAGVLAANVYAPTSGGAPPPGGARGLSPSTIDSVLGSFDGGHPRSDGTATPEVSRLPHWSSSAVLQGPPTGDTVGGGVLGQSELSVLRRESTASGNRIVSSKSASTVFGASAPSSFAVSKATTPVMPSLSAPRSGHANRGRGSGGGQQNQQLTPTSCQPFSRGNAVNSSVLGGGPNAHAPPSRGGAGGGGGGRTGRGRSRSGGVGGQRHGGGSAGTGGGGGFRRGG